MNLIPGTKDFSEYWQTISLWTKDGEYDGLTVYSKNTPWGRLSSYINVVSGEIYTFSAWVKSNAPNEFIRLTTDGGWSTPINPGLEGYIQNEWCRVKCVLKSVKTGQVYFGIETTSESENYKVSVCGYKLERGTVTNPVWTPAPQDVVVRSELEQQFEKEERTDLFAFADKNIYRFCSVKTNGDALNTPYKANLTGGHSEGQAMIFGTGNYISILYIPVGLSELYITKKSNGEWENIWYKVNLTKMEVLSDESHDDMEVVSPMQEGDYMEEEFE